MPTKKKDQQQIDFLIEAYKIRVQLYSDLTNRMWTRFNYLLVTNTALFGFFFDIWLKNIGRNGVFWFPTVGIIISSIWLILGVQDRYYFEGFRIEAQEIEKEIADELGVIYLKNREFGSAKGAKIDLLTRRWKLVSLSRLPALVPILFGLLWTVMIWVVASTH